MVDFFPLIPNRGSDDEGIERKPVSPGLPPRQALNKQSGFVVDPVSILRLSLQASFHSDAMLTTKGKKGVVSFAQSGPKGETSPWALHSCLRTGSVLLSRSLLFA